MTEQRKPLAAADRLGIVTRFFRTMRLVWRLLNDARVPFLSKLIIPTTLLYVISPIDLIPDMIVGLGQLDDIAVFTMGVAMFIEMCPRDVVEEHRRAIATSGGLGDPPFADNVIDGESRQVPHDT